MNYAKKISSDYYMEVISLLKSYEGKIEGVVSYSFAVRFTNRRSKNVLADFLQYLLPVSEMEKSFVIELMKKLQEMAVLDFNDGNMTFE